MTFKTKITKKVFALTLMSLMVSSSVGGYGSYAQPNVQSENVQSENLTIGNGTEIEPDQMILPKLDEIDSSQIVDTKTISDAMTVDDSSLSEVNVNNLTPIEGDSLSTVQNAVGESSDQSVENVKASNKGFTGFVKENGRWYFYENNILKKGWITYKGVTYYIINTYYLPQNMWRKINGYLYYFNQDGVMIQNQKATIDGKVYQFDSKGRMIDLDSSTPVDVVDDSTQKIYDMGSNILKDSVSNVKNGIINEKGLWYKYVDGKRTRGWYKENGNTYYFLNTLNRAENMWRMIKGRLYYFGQNGVMYQNTIKYIGRATYKFNSDGSLDQNAKTTLVLQDTDLKEKANSSSRTYTRLKKGSGVEIVAQYGSWSQVVTSGGKYKGWVPNNTITTTSQQKIDAVISMAKSKLGSPYVWGGTGPNTFDCSGLMYYSFKNAAGITLPRVSKYQATVGTYVSKEDLKPGDLIFWGNPIHHVALYIGNGKYIHAPQPGDVVRIANLGVYTTARRIIQ